VWRMALGSSPPEDVREVSRVVTPSWVTPALFALWGAAAIAEILTGHVVTGLVIAAATAVALVIAIIFRKQLRAFNLRRSAASEATYGSLSLFGVGWLLLGLWRLMPPPSDMVVGGVCVGMGLIMVLAYAPAFIRRRSLARHR
jgi:hypothetical protein